MKIQYASDLHLEFADNQQYIKEHPLKKAGDILVLAGDIGYLPETNYTKYPFWDWASDNYKQVICCMGNHEFYKYFDISKLEDGYCIEIRHNVHSYYNAVVNIDDIDFIVSTLWSHIPIQEAYYTEHIINDFRRILYKGELLTFTDFNNEHKHCLDFIKNAVKKSVANHKIIISHHVPSFKMQCPKFTDSLANGAFIVDLDDYIRTSGIDYWIYGHSHYNVDMNIGSTLCCSNQLGYTFHNEHKTFDCGKTLEIK